MEQQTIPHWLFPPPRNRGVDFGHGISVDEINATLNFFSL